MNVLLQLENKKAGLKIFFVSQVKNIKHRCFNSCATIILSERNGWCGYAYINICMATPHNKGRPNGTKGCLQAKYEKQHEDRSCKVMIK